MIQVCIKNVASQQITNGPIPFDTQEDAEAWVNRVGFKASQPFGKPAYTKPAEYEEGVLISPELEVPSEWEPVYEDITEQVNQQEVNSNCRHYLSITDWYAIRFLESGTAIPQDISDARAAARAAIVD